MTTQTAALVSQTAVTDLRSEVAARREAQRIAERALASGRYLVQVTESTETYGDSEEIRLEVLLSAHDVQERSYSASWTIKSRSAYGRRSVRFYGYFWSASGTAPVALWEIANATLSR